MLVALWARVSRLKEKHRLASRAKQAVGRALGGVTMLAERGASPAAGHETKALSQLDHVR